MTWIRVPDMYTHAKAEIVCCRETQSYHSGKCSAGAARLALAAEADIQNSLHRCTYGQWCSRGDITAWTALADFS